MKDRNVRRWSRFHKAVFRASRGRVGKRLVDNDMLLLTTIGRQTGQPHTVPLLYLTDERRLVVIASYGGRNHHPEWYLNLDANPDVTVEIPGETMRMTARAADPREHAEWWPRVEETYDGYARYQSLTERVIPLVFLELTE